MKPLNIIGLILLIFGLSHTTTSAQTIQEQLIGDWSFNYEASYATVEAKTKTHLEDMQTVRRERIENSFRNRKMTFLADGTFQLTLSDGRGFTGTWALRDNNTLDINNPNGEVTSHNIESLSTTTLILEPESSGIRKHMFPQWHFTKN